jgi:hypothetical protein
MKMKTLTSVEFGERDFRDMLEDGEAVKVTGEGYEALYIIVNPEQAMRQRIEGIASQIDGSRGFPRVIEKQREIDMPDIAAKEAAAASGTEQVLENIETKLEGVELSPELTAIVAANT